MQWTLVWAGPRPTSTVLQQAKITILRTYSARRSMKTKSSSRSCNKCKRSTKLSQQNWQVLALKPLRQMLSLHSKLTRRTWRTQSLISSRIDPWVKIERLYVDLSLVIDWVKTIALSKSLTTYQWRSQPPNRSWRWRMIVVKSYKSLEASETQMRWTKRRSKYSSQESREPWL